MARKGTHTPRAPIGDVRDPESLHHYLQRFNAWQADRSQGLDAIMLAPTRELVRALNQRARDHRLAGSAPGRLSCSIASTKPWRSC